LKGLVVRGEGLGRKLGFPTANIKPLAGRPPARGVYAVLVLGRRFPAGALGACNVGVRPTVGGRRLVVEAHIPGFKGDLYGKRLKLIFLKRLRPEKRFPNLAALKAQMRRDVRVVRSLAPSS